MNNFILVTFICILYVSGQKITTIQINGARLFISQMNPYTPKLNFFLAYQYCRSLGFQLISFETKEKADTIMQYLKSASYTKHDFWTSGNNFKNDMLVWMSTGLPFNSTFHYMIKSSNNQFIAQTTVKSTNTENLNKCVAMLSPNFVWKTQDCMLVKDFICEQVQCHNNYNIISESVKTGHQKLSIFNSLALTAIADEATTVTPFNFNTINYYKKNNQIFNKNKILNVLPNILNSLKKIYSEKYTSSNNIESFYLKSLIISNINSSKQHNDDLNIAKFLTNGSKNKAYQQSIKTTISTPFEFHTIGPYDTYGEDYQADEVKEECHLNKDSNDDSSTILPQAEASYRYNIRVRTNGKVLNPTK